MVLHNVEQRTIFHHVTHNGLPSAGANFSHFFEAV